MTDCQVQALAWTQRRIFCTTSAGKVFATRKFGPKLGTLIKESLGHPSKDCRESKDRQLEVMGCGTGCAIEGSKADSIAMNLDAYTLDAYTRIAQQVFPGAVVTHAATLTGGVSADIYRLELLLTDSSTKNLVLRAHRSDHSGHPAELEYQLLRALYQSALPVPEPLLVDTSASLLQAPYLLMAFVEGSSVIRGEQLLQHMELMAAMLLRIHALPTTDLPLLPSRNEPMPELLAYLPRGSEWDRLREYLASKAWPACEQTPRLLHGDFWPQNLLWRNGAIAGILDWEDAALGDPLSDVACCELELRYKFGKLGMDRFMQAYTGRQPLDVRRLALWRIYVAAAAQQYMGEWDLAPALELHMRGIALASIREAGLALMTP
jgi:aminoglycoside phosphotransferase (APT) family kinase protein